MLTDMERVELALRRAIFTHEVPKWVDDFLIELAAMNEHHSSFEEDELMRLRSLRRNSDD